MRNSLIRAILIGGFLLTPQLVVRAQSANEKVVGTLAAAAHTQRFDFGSLGDVQSAQLQLFPASFQRSVGGRIALDGYGAYGIGIIRRANTISRLEGPVDSWLRLRLAANHWAVLAVGVALPTGVSRHTAEQAAVASVLSNELLGFREGNWGGGGSATFGISTAFGNRHTKLTLGGSYKVVRAFEPSADTSFRYQPGNEGKVHAGIEQRIGPGQLFLGGTAQRFTADRADSKNLFQAGPRYRGDISYSAGNFNIFAADMWRARGDLILPVIDAFDGGFLRDTSFTVGWQNLAVAGLSGVARLSDNFSIVSTSTFKTVTREDKTGRGWLATLGLTFPSRIGGTEFFPAVKLSRGALAPSVTPFAMQDFWGVEMSFVIRRSSIRARRAGGGGA